MRKREHGWAFIMVLIILAIGALVSIPALRLTQTATQGSRIIGTQNRGLYACEAAQEFVMWQLYHGNLVETLGFEPGENSANFTVDVCGTEADVTVVMRAVELEGGVTLSSNQTMMPTKAVSPDHALSKNDTGPFTYTITVKQVSGNNTNGLDAIYDIISSEFKGKAGDLYVGDSSEISTDGVNWEQIEDPGTDLHDSLLRWPATGSFNSPFRDFYPGQEKYLRFQMTGPFNHDDEVVCNWVVVQVADVFSVSGPQAPITVGNPTETECTDSSGTFQVNKTSNPTVIPPLQETEVTYTITITNMEGSTRRITQIDDYLPPGFAYMDEEGYEPWGDITDMHAYEEDGIYNGVERGHLRWESGYQEAQLGQNGVEIAAGANMTLSFVALAEQGISGNYYNEVIVAPDVAIPPGAFAAIPGFDPAFYGETYSWNSGVVIVPAYDSEAESEGVTIDANMALAPDGVQVISWHVD
jgi:hypothetical protein